MSRGGVHNAFSRGILPTAMARAMGDMEGSSGLERYGETLQPLVDLWGSPEFAYLRGEHTLCLTNVMGPIAGEYSAVALLNPAASGVLAVVERARFQVGANWGYLALATEAAIVATLGAVGKANAIDTREYRSTTQPGGLIYYNGSDPALIGPRVDWELGVAGVFSSFESALPIVLGPGYGVVIQAGIVNTNLNASFRWRERKAFPGELE